MWQRHFHSQRFVSWLYNRKVVFLFHEWYNSMAKAIGGFPGYLPVSGRQLPVSNIKTRFIGRTLQKLMLHSELSPYFVGGDFLFIIREGKTWQYQWNYLLSQYSTAIKVAYMKQLGMCISNLATSHLQCKGCPSNVHMKSSCKVPPEIALKQNWVYENNIKNRYQITLNPLGYESKVNEMRKFWNLSGLNCAAALSHTYKKTSLIKHILADIFDEHVLLETWIQRKDNKWLKHDGANLVSYVTLWARQNQLSKISREDVHITQTILL